MMITISVVKMLKKSSKYVNYHNII